MRLSILLLSAALVSQDMSVAGKRAGLDGSRSNLFYQAVRIIKEMRCKTDGKYPRYIVWENVPGAFSSNKGEDFRCVLESICRVKDKQYSVPACDKWQSAGEIVGENFSLAWRVLDAQFWGVPQRRKRIYLVADFDGECAGKILFESEGLSGYSAESFRSWQGAAGASEESIGKTSCLGVDGYNSAASDKAATLGVNCGMSTGRNGVMVLNDQGGNRMDVTEDKTATLRAESHHPPLVFENHSQDTRYTGPMDVAQTVLSTFGTGGNNQPFVVEEADGFDCRNMALNKEKSATLHAKNNGGHSLNYINPVVYGICAKDSNSMKSDNPHSGFYEAETSRCLDGNGGNPSCNQGGMAVVALEGNGSRPSHHGDGYCESNVSYTLNATETHGVAYGIGRDAFNQGQNAQYKPAIEEEVQPTLVAKGPGAVAEPTYFSSKAPQFTETSEKSVSTFEVNDLSETDYIVRRLTPTECARLQGFPDWWCSNLGTEHPTNEEVYEWYKIFETYRIITGTSSKPKTEKQIRKFLEDPYSDSAEYKMWGNGIALPCAVFVLAGIKHSAM